MQIAAERIETICDVGQTGATFHRCNIEPSSVVDDSENVDSGVSSRSWTTTCDACAYFCTFCSASSTQKYTAASMSCG